MRKLTLATAAILALGAGLLIASDTSAATCDRTAPAPSGSTTALRTFLVGVPDGTALDPDNVCLVAGASYTTSQQLTLTKNHVWIDLQGATVTSTNTASNRNVFNFVGGSDLRLDNGTLKANTSGTVTNGHGVNVGGVQGFGSAGIAVLAVRDDGYHIAANTSVSSRPMSTNVDIESCVTTLPHRHAISVVGAQHVTIRGCNLGIDNSDPGGTIIDIEPLGGHDFVDDVLIDANTLQAYSASGARRSVQVNSGSGSTVSGVTVQNNAMVKVGMLANTNTGSTARSSNLTFTGNHPITEPGAVRTEPIFKGTKVDGLAVTNNRANLGTGGSWVSCSSCTSVTNTGNVDLTP